MENKPFKINNALLIGICLTIFGSVIDNILLILIGPFVTIIIHYLFSKNNDENV